MFVINTDSRGLGTLATTLAKDKYIVYSYSTTAEEAAALAPYLWGLFNSEANLTNAAQFIGQQVVGGKAEFAGDQAMHNQPRKFGLVTPRVPTWTRSTPPSNATRHPRDTGAQLHRERLTAR